MRKLLLLEVIFVITIFWGNIVYAGDIPLINMSSKQIASMLNSPEIQRQYGGNYGRLSPITFYKHNNGRTIYKSFVDGGNIYNGSFLFEEDSNGRIYDIVCTYNKYDTDMSNKCMRIMAFYFYKSGIDTKYILPIFKNLTNLNNNSVGNYVWVPSLNGFLFLFAGAPPESPNSIMIGFTANSIRS